MIWYFIIPIAVFIALFAYLGLFSPIARLQRAANKRWLDAIALFCHLDDWEISNYEKGVCSDGLHKCWKIIGPDRCEMFLHYNGGKDDKEALLDVERVLRSDTAMSQVVGKVVPASKTNVLSFIKHGTWAMFEKGDEPEFVIDRLTHLEIIDEDTARTALDDFNRTGHHIVITKTCYSNVSYIMFFFKENELMRIQIRYKYPDFNPFFFREEKNMIGILGVPSGKTECNATWDNISLRWVEDNNLVGSKSGLVLFIDFAKPVR